MAKRSSARRDPISRICLRGRMRWGMLGGSFPCGDAHLRQLRFSILRSNIMFAIAPTDLDWFERIRTGPIGSVVNFWTPTPWEVKGLHQQDRLYFMLKSPIRKIGCYGTFLQYKDSTAKEAWSSYGVNNGIDSELELIAKISRFAEKRSKNFSRSANPAIGCIELTDVVALDNDQFVAAIWPVFSPPSRET